MNGFSLNPVDFSPEVQLRQVKASILRGDLPNILSREQRKGFPKKYTLLLRQRGRETKRKLGTLHPDFFKIGTIARPTEINFVAGEGMQDVVKAVEFAARLFVRRAPVETGDYVGSAKVLVNGVPMRTTGIRPDKLADGTTIFFGPDVPYASTIEAGHYTGYYNQPLRGGIMRYVAEAVRDKFGASVAVRLVYRTNGKYMVPQIEFGPAGAFTFSLGKTGARSRAARRRK